MKIVLSNKDVQFRFVTLDSHYLIIPKTNKMNLLFVQSTGAIYDPGGRLEAPHWNGCKFHMINGYSKHGGINLYMEFMHSTYSSVMALGSRLAPDVNVE
jgi:hypothetical protein